MFEELKDNNSYYVFIPSLQKEIKFKPLSIYQYKKIIADSYNNSFLNLGFKLSLFEIMLENSLENIQPNEYDLYVYGIYIRYYDVSKTFNKLQINLKQPLPFKIEQNNKIPFNIPSITEIKEYNNYLYSLEDKTANNLLMAEFGKYTLFENISFIDKIQIIKKYSIEDLNQYLKTIDNYKQTLLSLLQITSNTYLPFNSSLILE
jgi:hypothetical protein